MITATETEFVRQYEAIKDGAGVLDRSERGKLIVGGPEATEFLQGQITNDVEALKSGQGCYAALLTYKGRMLADMRVLRRSDDLLIDTEAAAVASLLKNLNMYKIGRQVEIADGTEQLALLSVMGPRAPEVVSTAAGKALELPTKEHDHARNDIGGASVTIVAADYGAPTLDLCVSANDKAGVLRALLNADAIVVDESVAECVRIESGRPRYGLDMTSETIPQEADINRRAVSFEKGCYVGQEVVARLFYRGHPNRRLCGLMLPEPVSGGASLRANGRAVGKITSTTVSPACGPIALGMLRREVGPGDRVEVEGGISAQVVDLPFQPLPAGAR